jgi:4-hydroxybenzoyl-CoA thioesterase
VSDRPVGVCAHQGGIPIVFSSPIKVCFGDIDHAGIVYYPRFLHYFHLAFEEFFCCELGIDFAEVIDERNLSFPTVHVEADFRQRLRYGDRIDIEVRVAAVGRSSITWEYSGYRRPPDGDDPQGADLVVEGKNVTVCMRSDCYEKTEVPPWLREALEDYRSRTDP